MDNILNNNTRTIGFNNLTLDTILTTYNNLNFNSKWRSYFDSTGYYIYARGASGATPPHSITFPYTISYVRLNIFHYIGSSSNPTITINSNTYNLTRNDVIITLKTRTNQLDCTFNTTATDYCIRYISYY